MEKSAKSIFSTKLNEFVKTLNAYVATADGQWTIKGFIDVYRRIYTISSDTKIVSKLLEIHLFPRLLVFAEEIGYALVSAEKQNYYSLSSAKTKNINLLLISRQRTDFLKLQSSVMVSHLVLTEIIL